MTKLLCKSVILLLLGISSLSFAEWEFATIDDAAPVGGYVELAFDSQGNEHVAYADNGADNLKYAYYDGSSWQVEVVESAGDVGSYLSLALDQSDNPHISYYNNTGTYTGNLKYAYWDGTSWQIEVVDNISDDCGQDTAIDIDSNGYPHITYADNTNADLRYAYWDGSAWHLETIDAAQFVGFYGDMVLDENDSPHICYRNNTTGGLKYAEWNDTADTWAIEFVDDGSKMGAFTSIVLDESGFEHISYYFWPDTLMYARWDGASWNTEVVDGGGRHTSLALDEDGYPHITHNDLLNTSLKYAAWNGTEWELETIDNSGDVGVSTSLAFDELFQPHVAYRDLTNQILNFAWNNTTGGVSEGEWVTGFQLMQNTPNPFSSQTVINFELPNQESITLSIFDISGRKVNELLTSESHPPGTHQVTWDGRNSSGAMVSSGMYMYRIETSQSSQSKWMILLK